MTNRLVEYHDTLATTPLGANGPTFELWKHVPGLSALMNPYSALGAGRFIHDDFLRCGAQMGVAGALVGSVGPYACFSTATTGWVGADDEDAVATLALDADNDEAYLSGGSGAFVISDTAGEDRELIFEARIKQTSIEDNELVFALGLISPADAQAAGALIDDTGEIADAASFLGFR